MIQDLQRQLVQDWIVANTNSDIQKLALKPNPFPEIPYPDLLQQVAARAKAKDKLPTWFETSGIIYPSKISVEQTSSEATAAFKASLIQGDVLVDGTGGFGVDDYYFCQRFNKVIHCELLPELSEIVAHNANLLGIDNLECVSGNSTDYLAELSESVDWLYLDPSRRNETKGKVFFLKDCLPNVPELLDFYFSKTKSILMKTSPMLDISQGLQELSQVKSIYVVALSNEVKELLWVFEKGFEGIPEIKTVNLNSSNSEILHWKESDSAPIGTIKEFVYEPDAAIRKAGVFDAVAHQFGLKKLHRHTHLYTSDEIVPDFPGRTFRVEDRFSYNKTDMKSKLQNTQANITTRNFPQTVEEIRKKWKIKDGGSRYIFFLTDASEEKIVLICAKI